MTDKKIHTKVFNEPSVCHGNVARPWRSLDHWPIINTRLMHDIMVVVMHPGRATARAFTSGIEMAARNG